MWDLPGPGLKPMSPALTGGFLTTEPPGKSLITFLMLTVIQKLGGRVFKKYNFLSLGKVKKV